MMLIFFEWLFNEAYTSWMGWFGPKLEYSERSTGGLDGYGTLKNLEQRLLEFECKDGRQGSEGEQKDDTLL
jgi:hypothetical protein